MKKHYPNKQDGLILIFTLLTFLFIQGCCSRSHLVKRRGKLSEAMEKASDEYEGERNMETHYERVEEAHVTESCIADDYGDSQVADSPLISSTDSSRQHFGNVLSFSGGSGILSGDDFYGYSHLNIAYGENVSRRGRFQGRAGYMWAPLQTAGTLHHSLKNGTLLLHVGCEFQYLITPHYTFVGQYFVGGLAYHHMFWSFKNPIHFDDGETIRSDSISGLEIYAGAGINLMQTRYFQLGGEVLPGVIFWNDETYQKLENDIFGTFWHVKFRLSVNFIDPN